MNRNNSFFRLLHPGLTWIALVILLLLCLAMCVSTAAGATGETATEWTAECALQPKGEGDDLLTPLPEAERNLAPDFGRPAA
jgi:hypothetical protein